MTIRPFSRSGKTVMLRFGALASRLASVRDSRRVFSRASLALESSSRMKTSLRGQRGSVQGSAPVVVKVLYNNAHEPGDVALVLELLASDGGVLAQEGRRAGRGGEAREAERREHERAESHVDVETNSSNQVARSSCPLRWRPRPRSPPPLRPPLSARE